MKKNISQKWYRLDNAAKIYPVVTTIKESHVFRVSMTLKEDIIPLLLQTAVNDCQQRFPTFYVKMRTGLFWYYYEPNEKEPIVKKEPSRLCNVIDLNENNNYFFTVFYYQKRISLEVFHGICDASGAIEFLKAIVYQYLSLQNHTIAPEGLVKTISGDENISEVEDSYLKYYTKEKGKPLPTTKAYKLSGTRFDIYGSGIIKGSVNSHQLLALSKKYQATVTQVLVAILTYSIIQLGEPVNLSKYPVNLCVPVNLRRFFPSETIRNFSLYFHTIYPFKGKDVLFTDVLADIKSSFVKRLTKDDLQKKLNSNVGIEKMFIIKICPLFIKKIILRLGYYLYANKPTTINISNFGIVKLPPSMEKHIEKVEFYLGSTGTPSVAVSTYLDKTTISFARGIYESDLEKAFFTFLVKEGLDVELETNLWENNR